VCVTIRRAVPGDAQAIASLAAELNRLMREPADHFTPERVLRDGFGDVPLFHCILAERDGEVVGYAMWVPAYSTEYGVPGSYLQDLHVAERVRRQGIGRALMAAVGAEAKRQGLSFVWWASKIWNHEAQAFYRALGAVDEPIMAHAIYGEPLDRLADEAQLLRRER
jgi:GNAT superfamily N-acetyltransferase